MQGANCCRLKPHLRPAVRLFVVPYPRHVPPLQTLGADLDAFTDDEPSAGALPVVINHGLVGDALVPATDDYDEIGAQ